MKVFDATALIAFLSEMDFPDGLVELSKHYSLFVPTGVACEIKKSPGKERLKKLVDDKVITIVSVPEDKVQRMVREYPQLHRGECEAIIWTSSQTTEKKICILSDDTKARKMFVSLNFKWSERLLDIMLEKKLISPDNYTQKKVKLSNSSFYGRRHSE